MKFCADFDFISFSSIRVKDSQTWKKTTRYMGQWPWSLWLKAWISWTAPVPRVPSYPSYFTCDCAIQETTVQMLFIRSWSFSQYIIRALVPISIPQSHLLFSLSVVSDSLWPHGLQHVRLLWPWDSPGKNTGVGCHFLLQGIFQAQRSNLRVLHCRQILYHLSHKESP